MKEIWYLGIGLLIATSALAQDADIDALKKAQRALEDKAQAEAVVAIDPTKIDGIDVIVRPIRTPGVAEGDAQEAQNPKTINIKPGDAAFDAVLSALKGVAADKVEKATEALEASGVSVEIAPAVGPVEK